MTDIKEENRATTRVKALKGAIILTNNRSSSHDCMIRNFSEAGAKLVVKIPLMLPDNFDLRFEDGRMRRCSVRWRTPWEFGVAFLGATSAVQAPDQSKSLSSGQMGRLTRT